VFAQRSTVRLTDLPSWTGDDLHDHVVGGLHDRGFDVLVHLQPSDGDAVAAKVLVPDCEVETMSYGRIGERGCGVYASRTAHSWRSFRSGRLGTRASHPGGGGPARRPGVVRP
jgi:hypothetical protein